MNTLKHILLILAIVTGTSLALSSCGSDDNGSDTIVLDGLWEITEIEILPVEEEEATTEATTGDGSSTEDDAGAGSPPAKAGEEDNGVETAEPTVDLSFIRFGLNTYEYFMVTEEKVTTVSTGAYQLSGQTLSLTDDETSEIMVAMIEVQNTQLTITLTIDEIPQIWYAQKMQEDPYLDDQNNGATLVDFESKVHSADSVPGSLMNPDPLTLNETISGTLDTLISLETYKAEKFYYLKVDTTKTYQLKVNVFEPEYDLPAEFMEYVQVWLSYQPYKNNYKAEDSRIKSGEAIFYDIKSPTGYLYIRLFSYQNGIEYELTLTEQEEQN